MVHFLAHWERTIGNQPIRLYKNNGTLAERMRLDERIAFGIEFGHLKRTDGNVTVSLTFKDDEVPLELHVDGMRGACRQTSKRYAPEELDRLYPEFRQCEAGKYLRSPFVLAQTVLMHSVIAAKAEYELDPQFPVTSKFRQILMNKLELPGVSLIAEDFPLHVALHTQYPQLAAATPLFIMFAFSRFIISSIHDVVAEKESKLNEVMKIFGLGTAEHWVSWLLTACIMNLLYTGITMILCRLCNMFGESNYLVIAVLFYFYLLSLLTSGFLVSVFFDTLQGASAAGMVYHVVLNGVGLMLSSLRDTPQIYKNLLCFFSPVTFSLCIDEIIRALPMKPLTLSNWFDFRNSNIGFYTLALIGGSLGYWLLAWYLDTVLASSFGIALPWYWPITELMKYMTGARYGPDAPVSHPAMDASDDAIGDIAGFSEPVPAQIKEKGRAVQIRGLVKEFTTAGEVKRAVDNLSLDVYRSEIFALLGHNGAGKTTTISILTGMLVADGGDALVNGYSIRTESKQVQQSISVCPQHNIFFEELLCIEHLCFFAGLRGIEVREPLLKLQNPSVYAEEVMEQVQKMQMERQMRQVRGEEIHYEHSDTKTWNGVLDLIDRFGLMSKMFTHPRTLSGGQKRRLWLALALLAEPAVVFLDEPTSGVDPVGRQDIWKVIQEERKTGRCIILTTHHMEEADILADRKAVMAAGKLRCLGSSLFLKSKFGIGYYLEVQLERDLDPSQRDVSVRQITDLIRSHVPSVKPILTKKEAGTWASISLVAGVLIFALPLAELPNFGPLLMEMEDQKSTLSIRDYAVSMSTLEEVFFRLGEENQDTDEPLEETEELGVHGRRRSSAALPLPSENEAAEEDIHLGMNDSDEVAANLANQRFQRPQGSSLIDQLIGVTYLRYAQVFHNLRAFCLDVLLPTGCFLLGLFLRRGDGPHSMDLGFDVKVQRYFMNSPELINQTIPYYVDSELSNLGRQKVFKLIDQLPFKHQLMPLHPCMAPENLVEISGKQCQAALLEASKLSAERSLDVDFEVTPTTNKEYLLRRPTKLKRFGPDAPVIEEDYPYAFNIAPELRSGKVRSEGNILRNFVWRSTQADMFGVWDNFYPAAIQFEPNPHALNDDTPFDAVSTDPDDVLIRYMWNPYAPHSFPAFLNGLGTSVANNALPSKNGQHEFEFRSTPTYRDIPVYITTLTWALHSLLSLGMSFLPSRFGHQVMYDNYMKTKHSLIVMGCPFVVYWIGTFIINWLVMVLTNTSITFVVGSFIPLFARHPWSLWMLQACLLGHAAAMLVYGYFFTFVMTSSRSYSVFMQLSTMLLSLGPAYIVSTFYDYKLYVWGIPLRYLSGIIHKICVFTLAPYIPLGSMMTIIMIMNQAEQERRTARLDEFLSLNNQVVWCVLGAIFQTVVYGALIIYLDAREYTAKKPNRHAVKALKQWKEVRTNVRQQVLSQPGASEAMVPAQFQITKDQDVLQAEAEVDDIMTVYNAQMQAETTNAPIPRYFPNLRLGKQPKDLPAILIHNLHHLYLPTSSAGDVTVAQKGTSFWVKSGEVMGLLGPNGAGKSTTINLLTCDPHIDAPTEGDGYLGGISVSTTPQDAYAHIGLVPQFDALWPDVTVSDNLYTFAKVKGLSREERVKVTGDLLKKLDLIPHQHKRIHELSGGNKRRASIAVAFLGNPRVVLMDEPSSGIDPAGRRKLLEMLMAERQQRAIIITTHSMEEAESLCTKVGIVVNGQLQCLNTCLSIKNAYGTGLRLELELAADWRGTGRLRQSDRDAVVAWVKNKLHPDSVLTEEVASRLYFTIPVDSSKLGEIFTALSTESEQVGIKEYAVAQPTMDQVFAIFAKRQQNLQEP
ncbi:ABC transporter [Gregarina niphandrodes]|uniref:ABC transporter n=1 Tax=Gregarina niphandrodes TaxID=110365 RepID=A0A023B7L1_GRENI|nr:ABC transporter [Gregarina niphandrodes]EZG67505.1 ABC transporter [Gregarina niphandrodes]|eukprot:XP_011130220.1 ABC transporter [Gregarina niphandrodes]